MFLGLEICEDVHIVYPGVVIDWGVVGLWAVLQDYQQQQFCVQLQELDFAFVVTFEVG